MIKAEGISRNYGDFSAVDNVNFDIGSGEIVGLLGHNGAGKTTIMKMLTGYLQPSAGRISIDGIDVAEDPTAAQQRIGYLPENLPVYPEMTVLDYLEYCADMRGLDGEHRATAIRRAVATTDLQSKATSVISTLSRGFKQRVGVAQALLHQPRVLILDEPTNGLDPMQTRQMRELIKSLAETTTVILSTHIMQEVDAVCDRVLIIDGGRLVVDESLQTLRSSNQLQLETSANAAQVADLWQGTVDAIDTAGGGSGQRFVLTTADAEGLQTAAAALAKALVEGGHALYALAPLSRDLETVFREAHELAEVRDAA